MKYRISLQEVQKTFNEMINYLPKTIKKDNH